MGAEASMPCLSQLKGESQMSLRLMFGKEESTNLDNVNADIVDALVDLVDHKV